MEPVVDPGVTNTADPVKLETWSIIALPVYVDKAVTKLMVDAVAGANRPETVIVRDVQGRVTAAKLLTVTVFPTRVQVTMPSGVAAMSPFTEQLAQAVSGLVQSELNVILIEPPAGIPCCNMKLTL